MKISEIDRNLAVPNALNLPDAVFFDVKEAPIAVCGLWQVEKGKKFLRMPQEVADSTNEGVRELNAHTAGGRIRFRTNSPYIALKAVMPDNPTMPHITMVGQSGFDLYVSDAGQYAYCGSFIPGNRHHGYEQSRPTDGQMHTYTIHMPLYDSVEEVYIGLARGAELEAPEAYRYTRPVVYYGSSITQGGCASRPGNTNAAMLCRYFDCPQHNLGFSGNGKGEIGIARYIASLPMTALVMDYDHNAPSAAHLERTHLPFVQAILASQPDLPVLIATRPDFSNGDPADNAVRREAVRRSYETLKAQGASCAFIDGETLFDGPFSDNCTVDGCHPNDLGFYRMAMKMLPPLRRLILGEETA